MSATPAKFLREENVWRDIRARVVALKKEGNPCSTFYVWEHTKEESKQARPCSWLAGWLVGRLCNTIHSTTTRDKVCHIVESGLLFIFLLLLLLFLKPMCSSFSFSFPFLLF